MENAILLSNSNCCTLVVKLFAFTFYKIVLSKRSVNSGVFNDIRTLLIKVGAIFVLNPKHELLSRLSKEIIRSYVIRLHKSYVDTHKAPRTNLLFYRTINPLSDHVFIDSVEIVQFLDDVIQRLCYLP